MLTLLIEKLTASMRQLINAFTQRIIRLQSKLQLLKLQRFAAIAFVGLLLLTTSVDSADLQPSTKAMLNDMIARGADGRPVTTGQWQSENESLQGKPGKQAKRIVKESADAIDEMGDIYPDNAKTVLPGMKNDSLAKDER